MNELMGVFESEEDQVTVRLAGGPWHNHCLKLLAKVPDQILLIVPSSWPDREARALYEQRKHMGCPGRLDNGSLEYVFKRMIRGE